MKNRKTVRELVEELQVLDQDKAIWVFDFPCFHCKPTIVVGTDEEYTEYLDHKFGYRHGDYVLRS